MSNSLEMMQAEIMRLRRQLEAFQSGGYSTVQFVPLTTQLTSTSWDGDAFSTAVKTLLDLSAVFGAPAGIKAALFRVSVQDSGASAYDARLVLSPNNSDGVGPAARCFPANDRYATYMLNVPCDSNGDVYYQIYASGSSTMDISLQIWGYWI